MTTWRCGAVAMWQGDDDDDDDDDDDYDYDYAYDLKYELCDHDHDDVGDDDDPCLELTPPQHIPLETCSFAKSKT